jgi:aspartyl-tRNA synthetase
VAKSRRLGDLVFVDLRNEKGITQIVFDKDNKHIELANKLRNEFVI